MAARRFSMSAIWQRFNNVRSWHFSDLMLALADVCSSG
jgi:hypothetical protein